MRKLLVLLALLASPAQAAISFDDLRALVLARDFAATDAALIAAHSEYTAAHTPDAERALYNVFALTDPTIQTFTENWARAKPTILAGLMTQEETIAALEAIQRKRPLTLKEAEKLDYTRMDLNRTLPQDATYPESKAALRRAIDAGDAALLRDPFNPDLLHAYVQIRGDAVVNLNRPMSPAEKADMIARLKTVLKTVPTAADLWRDLAQLTLREQDLDSIAQAEPYFHNAIHYSRYATRPFSDAVRPKVRMVQDQSNILKAVDISGLTPEELAKLDDIVNCPLVQQLSILGMVCQNTNTPANQCAEGAVTDEVVIKRLRDRLDAGACGPIVAMSLETLYEKPAPVDF